MPFTCPQVASLLAAIFIVSSCLAPAQERKPPSFAGVNWADGRDNFVDGWIIPSGIDHRLGRVDVAAQARTILADLKEQLGINSVRLGINPETVLDERWWPKYQAIVGEAGALDLKVILACWESAGRKDGKIDDLQRFNQMWQKVLQDSRDHTNVYFEIFNEPHGYRDRAWRDLASAWLTRFLPLLGEKGRGRILVSGSGYNERLGEVASDRRFDGCLLSFHLYSWFGGKHDSVAGWRGELTERIGPAHAARTVVTEWGAPMSGLPDDHYGIAPPAGDRDRAYLAAMAGTIRDWEMGSLYWPGLRDGDPFSLTTRIGQSPRLQITNQSGKNLLQHSFSRESHDEKDSPGEGNPNSPPAR